VTYTADALKQGGDVALKFLHSRLSTTCNTAASIMTISYDKVYTLVMQKRLELQATYTTCSLALKSPWPEPVQTAIDINKRKHFTELFGVLFHESFKLCFA